MQEATHAATYTHINILCMIKSAVITLLFLLMIRNSTLFVFVTE